MLPRDILLTIFLEVNDRDLPAGTKFFSIICANDFFWKSRGNKIMSTPFETLQSLSGKNSRDTYILFRSLQRLKNGILDFLNKDEVELFKLQKLDLSNSELTAIPKELGNLINLQRLWLCNNELTAIPKELGNLINLRHLILYNNELSSIPKELGHLEQLQTLDLSYNQLSLIPKELGNLKKLNKLDLSENHLSSIPEALELLTEHQLASLRLYGNLIKSIPQKIKKLLKVGADPRRII